MLFDGCLLLVLVVSFCLFCVFWLSAVCFCGGQRLSFVGALSELFLSFVSLFCLRLLFFNCFHVFLLYVGSSELFRRLFWLFAVF